MSFRVRHRPLSPPIPAAPARPARAEKLTLTQCFHIARFQREDGLPSSYRPQAPDQGMPVGSAERHPDRENRLLLSQCPNCGQNDSQTGHCLSLGATKPTSHSTELRSPQLALQPSRELERLRHRFCAAGLNGGPFAPRIAIRTIREHSYLSSSLYESKGRSTYAQVAVSVCRVSEGFNAQFLLRKGT